MCPIHHGTQDYKQQLTNANINSRDGTSAFFIWRFPLEICRYVFDAGRAVPVPYSTGDEPPSTVSPRPGNLATLLLLPKDLWRTPIRSTASA